MAGFDVLGRTCGSPCGVEVEVLALIRLGSVKYWPLAALIFVFIVIGVFVVALCRRTIGDTGETGD